VLKGRSALRGSRRSGKLSQSSVLEALDRLEQPSLGASRADRVLEVERRLDVGLAGFEENALMAVAIRRCVV